MYFFGHQLYPKPDPDSLEMLDPDLHPDPLPLKSPWVFRLAT